MLRTATNVSQEQLSRLKAAFAAATPDQIQEAAAGLDVRPVSGGKGRGKAPGRVELRELVRPRSYAWLAIRHLAGTIQRGRGQNSIIVTINAELAAEVAQRLKFMQVAG